MPKLTLDNLMETIRERKKSEEKMIKEYLKDKVEELTKKRIVKNLISFKHKIDNSIK